MKHTVSLIALITAFPAFAQDNRQLDAHEHGVGTLNIAMEGTTVLMEFTAPGADIVGFEYEATSDADLALIDAAIATLSSPLDLFVLPDVAGCSVVETHAELESEDDHGEHEDHGHDDDHHDEHEDEEHDDHGHDDDHHGEHEDEHADEAGHTELHAEYTLACSAPAEFTQIDFAYFETFPNAQEVEVQIITTSGAHAFEVERDAPVLELDH